MSTEHSEKARFALARSIFIDAYNEVDLAIRERLFAFQKSCKPMLGDNIEALAKLTPAPQYAKTDKTRIDGALTELRSLRDLRCDIVHSVMEVVTIDGQSYAIFPNVQDRAAIGRRGLFLSLAQFDEVTRLLQRIARAIRQQSHLQPVPAATAATA